MRYKDYHSVSSMTTSITTPYLFSSHFLMPCSRSWPGPSAFSSASSLTRRPRCRSCVTASHNLTPGIDTQVHVVVGSAGYLGKQLCHTIQEKRSPRVSNLDDSHDSEEPVRILGFVRPSRLRSEQKYWIDHPSVQIHSIDDLDLCLTRLCMTDVQRNHTVVHCVASNFRPANQHSASHETNAGLAFENVDLVRHVATVSCKHRVRKLVLTSSMAAVRGPGQVPQNQMFFTSHDWNDVSTAPTDDLDTDGGNDNKASIASFAETYPWSKMTAEKMAWEIVNAQNESAEMKTAMTALCPSMIVGPFHSASQRGQSVKQVESWLAGKRPVQSRLVVDVRDVACAHYNAACNSLTDNMRYIISTESRISALQMQSLLCNAASSLRYPGLRNMRIDDQFDGGFIKIGDKEVHCQHDMKEHLGLIPTCVSQTLHDMVLSIAKFSRSTS